MKKKIMLIIILIIIIILCIIIRKVWMDMNNAIPYSIMIVDEDKIKDYIISISETENENTENIKTFVAIENLKTEITEVNEENYRVILYAWIMTEKYLEKDGEMEKIARDAKPYKFTLYNTIVEQCEFPKEGSSLEQIFPKDVINQFSIIDEKELELEIERQIQLYYNKNQDYYNTEVNNIINDMQIEKDNNHIQINII